MLVRIVVLAVMLSFACCNSKKDNAVVKLENDPVGHKTTISSMRFEEVAYDFGTIKDRDTVQHQFKFTNTGPDSLLIVEVSSSCGCTIPEWPRESIPKDGEGVINVIFTKSDDPGEHSRLVIIKANTDPEYTTLKIKANVLPPPVAAIQSK